MQNDFRSGDICFIYVGYDRIKNSKLNHIIEDDDHPDNDELFEPYVINSCLNIFYVDSIRGKNSSSGGKIGGITFELVSKFCLVTNKSLKKHTSSHEVGHCFGLLHTFDHERYGYENINGDDCDDLGDIICDTRADPYAYKGGFCYSSDDGSYTGYCSDPNGQSNFDPPYNNIMSYWHRDPESFTLGQTQAMDVTIVNESDLSELISTDNYLFSGTYFVGANFKSASNTITVVGNCELLQFAQTGLFAKKIVVNAGFHAKPDVGGYTLLKGNECSGFALKSSIAAE